MWISRVYHQYLLEEIKRLRAEVERERDRADRAADNLMNAVGQMPISDLGRQENDKKKSAVAALAKSLEEVFADEVDDAVEIAAANAPTD